MGCILLEMELSLKQNPKCGKMLLTCLGKEKNSVSLNPKLIYFLTSFW